MPCETIRAYIFYLEMRGMRWQVLVCIVLQVCIQTKLLVFCMNMVHHSIYITSINIYAFTDILLVLIHGVHGPGSRYAFKPPCNTTTKCDITSKPSHAQSNAPAASSSSPCSSFPLQQRSGVIRHLLVRDFSCKQHLQIGWSLSRIWCEKVSSTKCE